MDCKNYEDNQQMKKFVKLNVDLSEGFKMESDGTLHGTKLFDKDGILLAGITEFSLKVDGGKIPTVEISCLKTFELSDD